MKKSAREFRAALERAGLSQGRAAVALDVSERMVRYYASGEHEPPRVVMFALAYLAEHPGAVPGLTERG